MHLAEALQYHKKELQKAFETAKELVQQCLDDVKKGREESQDDPENPIGVQNIEADEAMQDFIDLGDKIRDINVSEMIAKLNANQKRIFERVVYTVEVDKPILRLYVSWEGDTGKVS